MVNTQLIEYIQTQLNKGYNPEQLYQFLIQQGYPAEDIRSAINYSSQIRTNQNNPVQLNTQNYYAEQEKYSFIDSIKEKINLKNLIKISLILIIIILLIIGYYIYKSRPICGNGIIEKGETPDNCCEDTGCKGEQECIKVKEGSYCKEPICNICEYVENHICVKYECCENEMCNTDEICYANKCEKFKCYENQIAKDHLCIDADE